MKLNMRERSSGIVRTRWVVVVGNGVKVVVVVGRGELKVKSWEDEDDIGPWVTVSDSRSYGILKRPSPSY